MSVDLSMFEPPPHAEPRRPWRPGVRTLAGHALVVVVAGLLAAAVVATTGLAGKLGWFVATVVILPPVAGIAERRRASAAVISRIAGASFLVMFVAVLLPWGSLIVTVVSRGAKAFHSGFLTTDMLVNSPDDPLNLGGVSHAVMGTVLIVLMASVLAVPLGIVTAVYIVEVRGRAARAVRFFTQAMSGGPSIVAGLFVYATVVVSLTQRFNAVAGSLALAILMLPTVARTAEDVLKVVPAELRSASYALGASQFATTWRVVLPTVRSGLVTSAVLGVARVAGETAPLLLTSQYFVRFTTYVWDGPIASLPTYVFSSLSVGSENSVARAWAGSAVLLVLILVLFVTARTLGGRNRKVR
ncbi:MAG: phosphate ABC transporter permease PstA [Actinomycetota bacterium]